QLAAQDNAQPNVTVIFTGLTELLWPSPPNAQPPQAPECAHAAVPVKQIPPKLDVDSFAHQYDLSWALCDKLETIHLSGPHFLRFITDELQTEGNLSLGELAALRDAEER
ncbi:hypothetical protein BDN67DRAFT_913095, partial [Paxillus ammoniavirescens]